MLKQVKIKIFGNVQGVFFRYSAQKKASELGLTGWAKNAEDKTVEIVAEGEAEELEKFIDWCNYGPAGAKVEKVELDWQTSGEEFKNFEVK